MNIKIHGDASFFGINIAIVKAFFSNFARYLFTHHKRRQLETVNYNI